MSAGMVLPEPCKTRFGYAYQSEAVELLIYSVAVTAVAPMRSGG